MMISFDEFESEWLGKRIDYDHIYGFQCVDLIRQGFYEMHDLPGGGGVPSAITYWQATPDEVLRKFTRISNSDAQKGDVVVLWGLPGNADGHIGWATGKGTGTQIEILEQNGATGGGTGLGGDAIRTRYVDRSRVAGLLRPIAVAQAPAPTISVTPFATPQQWTHNGSLWNLDQPNFDAIAADVLSDTNPNPVTITAYLTRSDLPQYVYLLPDANVHHGYNQVDCAKYTPPPAPYVPPAAPAPIIATDEDYRVLTTITGYPTANSAVNDVNATGIVQPGSYTVFNRQYDMINVTKVKGRPGSWINPNMNVLPQPTPTPSPAPPIISSPAPVTPEPVAPSLEPVEQGTVKTLYYDWIDGVNHAPVWFHTLNVTEQRFKDLENPDAPQAVLPPNKDVRFSMVTIKGGMNYYIPTLSLNKGNRHGIPETLLKPVTPVENFLDTAESDYLDWADKLIEMPKKMYTLIADISPVSRHKVVYQAKQFVDGFKSKSGSKK